MKKLGYILLILVAVGMAEVAAQSADLANANRKTATRYLGRAENAFSTGNYDTAVLNAEMGLAYDDSISDLWYIAAAAENARGADKAIVLPLVARALNDNGQWVDYNKDGARLLYASILCDVDRHTEAIAVLDAAPFIYSADAEYIRAKSYYRMGTARGTELARNKINTARRIYQNDTRFTRLFFRHEYAALRNTIWTSRATTGSTGAMATASAMPTIVRSIANAFITKMPEYDNPDDELEIYAAIFAEGEERKRLLSAFSAHGMKHPLYALAAVRENIMTQNAAVDYFFSMESEEVELSLLSDFVNIITEQNARKHLAEMLNAYSGLLTIDTDGDLDLNMRVQYMRGRPETIRWDKNHDGIDEWTVKCDFGVPVEAATGDGTFRVKYGTYPAIVAATFSSESFNGSYTFADEMYSWTPCEIYIPEAFSKLDGCEFFVPRPIIDAQPPKPEDLVSAASHYESAIDERAGAAVVFTLVESQPVTADYKANGKLYAHGIFEAGLPVSRAVDNDGDGIFETTQFFGYDPDNSMHQAESEREFLRKQLFNMPEMPTGIYVNKVQTDTDNNALPDYTEEYLPDGGIIASWDTNGDGVWDTQYYRYPKTDGEPVREVSLFYKTAGHIDIQGQSNGNGRTLVSVVSVNGVPTTVTNGDILYDVTAGKTKGFYWIGVPGTDDDENRIFSSIAKTARQGVSFVYEQKSENGEAKNTEISDAKNDTRFFVIKIGKQIFAERTEKFSQFDDNIAQY